MHAELVERTGPEALIDSDESLGAEVEEYRPMDVVTIVRILLYILFAVLAGTAIWGIRELVETARSVRRLTDDLQATVPGLIERADTTLVSVNRELVRVDGVVRQLEEVSDSVTNTTRAARDIVETPAAMVTGLADGTRKFFSSLFGADRK